MSSNDSSAGQARSEIADKGKGKQVEQHADMMEEDDSESEESGAEAPEEEEEEDDLEEIDLDNAIPGRTRGKKIDWNEAQRKAQEAGDNMDDDDDDDDDDDFVAPDEDGDRMEE